LLAKSRTLLALDRPKEALDAAGAALAGLRLTEGAQEPPTSFLYVYNEAMDAVLAKNPPPAATASPNAVSSGSAAATDSHGTTGSAGTVASPPTPILLTSSGDAEFSRDPRGQWAISAEASSEYGPRNFSAKQATGAPDVADYGDSSEAWDNKTQNGREEWLRLSFKTPVHATAVRVRQTYNPGAVIKVEAFAADGRSAVVWSGKDTTVYPRRQIAWFTATFDPPPFPVQSIKLSLRANESVGIDAVQMVGDP
jgi:hypothetical protein